METLEELFERHERTMRAIARRGRIAMTIALVGSALIVAVATLIGMQLGNTAFWGAYTAGGLLTLLVCKAIA